MTGQVFFSKDVLGALNTPPDEEPAQMAPPARTVKSANKSRQLSTQNVLKLARARRRDVKAEIKRLRVLEKELAELERLITAAEDTKPRLKKVAG